MREKVNILTVDDQPGKLPSYEAILAELGEVLIKATRDEQQVFVSVRDDGTGIPDHIATFRPGSAGVGIAGMKQRLDAFDGELRLQNTDPGTLVEVVVPLHTADRLPTLVSTGTG
ncbi:MAG: ATP-binding protein [Candidatus Acidiferrum sp.]|jgi:glucose-6-phosphate-specific signal transduction histidine kinase